MPLVPVHGPDAIDDICGSRLQEQLVSAVSHRWLSGAACHTGTKRISQLTRSVSRVQSYGKLSKALQSQNLDVIRHVLGSILEHTCDVCEVNNQM